MLRLTILTSSMLAAPVALAAPLLAAIPPAGAESATVGDPVHLVMMITYTSIALVFSFMCSVAEAVVLSVSPAYIASLEKEGGRSAPRLRRMKKDIDRSLAAILTLNTIAHTIGAGGAGAEAASYLGQQYVGVAMAILTLLILFLSEIIPKTIGAIYWRSLAGPTALFIQVLIWMLYPLIVLSELLTKLLTRGKSIHRVSREEISATAEIGAAQGEIDAKEFRILRNLFRFAELRAEDVMTPRTVVFALQQDLTVGEALAAHPDIRFSRIPIFAENRDDITGVVLFTDMLVSQHRNNGQERLSEIRRDVDVVPGVATLSHVMERMLKDRHHILLVIDEYGGLDGIVTLEDIVETLIGMEIVDEADQVVDMRKVARDKWKQRIQKSGIDWSD